MYLVFRRRLEGFQAGKIFLIGKFYSKEEAANIVLRGNCKAFTPFYYWVEKKGE